MQRNLMAPKLRTFYAFIALLTLCAGVMAQGKAADTVPEHLRCADNRKIILSCKTKKNRLLQLCDAGDSVVYSYGRFNETPILIFANKKSDIPDEPSISRNGDEHLDPQWSVKASVSLINSDLSEYFVGVTKKGESVIYAGVKVSDKAKRLMTSDQCLLSNNQRIVYNFSSFN